MGNEDFFKEVPSFIGVLSARGVVPEDIVEHYVSWGAVQHGEAGDTLEGTVLLVTEQWFYICSIKRVGEMEEAVQRALPLTSLREVGRTWRGSRGFDESEGTHTAEEYAAVIKFEDEDEISLPLKDTDYNQPYKAWRRAHALTEALLRKP